MKKNLQKGFTLLELLVVVSIIALLVTIVIASLSASRNKGADAAIKQDFSSARTQSVLYSNTNGNYGTGPYGGVTSITSIMGCPQGSGNMLTDKTFCSALVHAAKTSGNDVLLKTASANVWIAGVPLKTSGWLCVDSLNVLKSTTTSDPNTWLTSNNICP